MKRSRWRSGRILLWAAGFFISLQVGLAVAIEAFLPELRDPEFACRAGRLLKRTAHPIRIPTFEGPISTLQPTTVVMIGSSRTAFGFKADLVEPQLASTLGRPTVVFNFGIMGAGPLMELIDLRRLLTAGLHPDLLLVEVLPPLLAGQIPPLELYRLSVDRVWFAEVPLLERYGRKRSEIRVAWCEDWPVPWYSHRYAILSRLAPACLPTRLRMDWAYHINQSGWVDGPVRSSTVEGRRQSTENARQEYAIYFQNFRVGGPACQALRELLQLCRSSRIPTAMVLMPEGTEFRSWYPPHARRQIECFLQQAGMAFDADIIDARQWMPDSAFSDSHHLLPDGAEAFTLRLGEKIAARLTNDRFPMPVSSSHPSPPRSSAPVGMDSSRRQPL